LAEFHLSGGKKVVVDLLSNALVVKLRVKLINGWDSNASWKKAVSLEALDGLRCLKSFILL